MLHNKVLFNNDWEFSLNGNEYCKVELPHDWLIYNTDDLYQNGIGKYRKEFVIESIPERYELIFEGVYVDTTLFINNKKVKEWKNGYSTFYVELSNDLRIGKNIIEVEVNHKSPNGRWYSGAGIYRNIWLKISTQNHFITNGIYTNSKPITQNDYSKWSLEIESEINTVQNVYIEHRIIKNGVTIATSGKNINYGEQLDRQIISINEPKLWSPERPELYSLESELFINSENKKISSDLIIQNIGFKDIVLDHNLGFIENGKVVKLQGTCEHHDLGALGAAVNKSAIERRLKILKDMGVNAIRTAHNMPAVELMDLADSMGFYIVSEAFDMWERPKVKYDYARFFKDWAELDVESWIKRDRNHPSIIMWSIGNEIYDTHMNEYGQDITKRLISYVQKHDSKKNGIITIGSNYMPWENAQKCADIVKVAGYNYGEKYYKEHHKKNPDWIIYGSETCSVVQSRGIYHFPYSQSLLADDDEQCSSLGNSTTSWGARSTEGCIRADRDTKFSLGQFIWTGFDYIGEPTPYHTKNSYFGQIDTAGFKKDSYYIFQSEWTCYKTNPMIHIFPYWDFNPGQTIDIRVCSNAPKIELFFNGESLGYHIIDHENGTNLIGHWILPFQKGELKALAYDENNNVIAEDIIRSFSDAKNIVLKTDKTEINADSKDLLFVEITTTDIDGNPVHNANNRVNVEVRGEGRLIGLDNGDSTDYDAYKGTNRRLFSGKLLAIIAPTYTAGDIEIIVSGEELNSQTLKISSTKTIENGIRKYLDCNTEQYTREGAINEIPLRKIELNSKDGQLFTPESNTKIIDVKLFPFNTSYRDIEFKIVNNAGIESKIAKITFMNEGIQIEAISDGEFQLKALSKNGCKKTRIISQLDFRIEGLGEAYKNPYEFISAGLFDRHKGEVTNGNERGVATSRDGETIVTFDNIDFGTAGSSTINIPIFALSDEVYDIEIWEGMANEEGSSIIDKVIYQKPSKWNVYQPETYTLSRTLTGIKTISFLLNKKVHIKGFTFLKENRAFKLLNATDSNHIYGDNFEINGNCVEKIGNNVSLEFNEMDFNTLGTSSITIVGESPIERNSIHIRFLDENGEEERRIVEFDYSIGYVERSFNFEPVKGLKKVIFVFLPGSNFDFQSFFFS